MPTATELTTSLRGVFWVTSGFLEIQGRMLTATELTTRGLFWVTSYIFEVLCRMLTATDLTKRCILVNQGLFRDAGQNGNSN